MTKTTKIAGLALAAVIGLGALSGGAQAAPFAGTNPAAGAMSGIEQVSERHGGRHGHRPRHRHGHRHGHPYRPHWRPHRQRCFYKKVRVYDPYYDDFFYRTRRICRW